MSNSGLSANQRKFVDALGEMLREWNLPSNAARLYGYLMIRNEPVGLDEIARDLEISRTHAHTAAKLLESHKNAQRVTVRGSKRILYSATDDPGAPLRQMVESLGAMAGLIQEALPDVASGKAAERLDRLVHFDRDLQAAMLHVINGVTQN